MRYFLFGLALAGLVFSCSNPLSELPAPAPAAATADNRALDVPVLLVHAHSLLRDKNGVLSVERDFQVKVKAGLNPSPARNVFIHHETVNGTWIDLPAYFVETLEPGFELWRVNYRWDSSEGQAYPLTSRFCAAFSQNGSTAWDNNYGKDFFLARDGGDLLGNSINVLQVYTWAGVDTAAGTATIHGAVELKNNAYQKLVTIHYTLDNWKTVKTVSAVYNDAFWNDYSEVIPSPNKMGVEIWNWELPLTTDEFDRIQYVISYKVAGSTWWDNNCSRNFSKAYLQVW